MTDVHIHLHCGCGSPDVAARIRAVTQRLDALVPGLVSTTKAKEAISMTRSDDVTVALADLDRATNDLGARVQTLIDEINSTAGVGLDGPQTEAVLAHLGALKAQLTAIGSSPTNPLPVPAPPPGPVQ
jgi:hypothetical protein